MSDHDNQKTISTRNPDLRQYMDKIVETLASPEIRKIGNQSERIAVAFGASLPEDVQLNPQDVVILMAVMREMDEDFGSPVKGLSR